ncbi:MAG TPA: sugar phosphate isomerase/epimerase [Pirellulales bacterium]|jgi:sugar phosphate isomerase/epimerase|nr:sugar phosphate isomerase/epimerase [Pirellulales bacterium]
MSVSVSRRHFLAAAASGVAAGSALLSSRHVWAAPSSGDLKLGLQMYSLRKIPVDDALKDAKELGFETIEMYGQMFPVTSTDDQIKEMLAKIDDLGLKLLAHGVNPFTKDHEKNRATFEFARKAGIPNITADPTPEAFDSLDKLVAEYDIRIAIHNHGPKHRYNKVTDVLNAIKDHDTRIGACADLGHYIRSGEDPVEVIRSLQGRLYGVHLKDFAEMQDKTHGVILGKGHLDVPAVFAAMRAVQFPSNGAMSLEYEEHPEDPIDEIRQCVAVAKAAM